MRSRAVTAGAALFALAVAGCSGGDDRDDAVQWVDSVCSSISDEVEAISTPPAADPSDPQAGKDSLVGYLGTLETSLDGMASAVEDAGTPPVEGGEDTVRGFVEEVGSAKKAVTSAKATIEGASVDDTAAYQTAVRSAMEDLRALSEINPTGSFSDNAELDRAYDEATACKELGRAAS